MTRLLLNEETIAIRWMDMDAYNHVAHQKYFDYLTEVRHAQLIKPYLPHQKEKFFLVDIGCQFKKPLSYPGTTSVKQFLVAKGSSSFALEFEFYNDDGQLSTIANAILVAVDGKSHEKITIPHYLQKQFVAELPRYAAIKEMSIDDNLQPLLIKTIPIRYADIDAFLHVNNSRYFDYMLEARHALFPDNNPLDASCYFFMVDARCSFYKPLNYPSNVDVEIYLLRMNRSSFAFAYNFYKQGDNSLIATGETTLVCVDKQKLKPIKIPNDVLEIIK